MDFHILEKNRDNLKCCKNIKSELLWGSRHLIENPLLTVLIITYKRPQLFYQALQSVLIQQEVSFAWDVLVIDNNPRETEVLKIVETFGDHRVRYYRNHENIGHEGSMNRGIALAAGTWVALLHDDDLLVRNYLVLIEKYLTACSKWKKPLAYIRAKHICFEKSEEVKNQKVSDEIEASCFVKPELRVETLFRGCGPTYVNSCGSIVNRKAFCKAGGYNPQLNPICDATLGILFMNLGYSIYASERVLGFYRQGKNLSAKKETVLRLIHADYLFREYLYKQCLWSRLFGICFRGVQYREAVDAKFYMAKKYGGEVPSMDEINQIFPYKKHVLARLLLKILQNIVDLCYRQRRFSWKKRKEKCCICKICKKKKKRRK